MLIPDHYISVIKGLVDQNGLNIFVDRRVIFVDEKTKRLRVKRE